MPSPAAPSGVGPRAVQQCAAAGRAPSRTRSTASPSPASPPARWSRAQPLRRALAAHGQQPGAAARGGVKHVTVRQRGRGQYRIWIKQTTDTQGVYRGQAGHTYRFLALATDNAGTRETPPLGTSAPDDGSRANLGAIPVVARSSADDDPPPAPAPPQPLPPNALFVLAQQGVPAAPAASHPSEYQSVLRPFTSARLPRASVKPSRHRPHVVELPDGSLLAGGAGRNQLSASPGKRPAGNPLVALPHPIFALAVDGEGGV
jgi:hypothetical protein